LREIEQEIWQETWQENEIWIWTQTWLFFFRGYLHDQKNHASLSCEEEIWILKQNENEIEMENVYDDEEDCENETQKESVYDDEEGYESETCYESENDGW
jgi:hypothetical protein